MVQQQRTISFSQSPTNRISNDDFFISEQKENGTDARQLTESPKTGSRAPCWRLWRNSEISVLAKVILTLACIFRVMAGNFTTRPSTLGSIFTWQPNLDVSVRPNARSSMSFSSSSGSARSVSLSYLRSVSASCSA